VASERGCWDASWSVPTSSAINQAKSVKTSATAHPAGWVRIVVVFGYGVVSEHPTEGMSRETCCALETRLWVLMRRSLS
jgi:hypothetical protein